MLIDLNCDLGEGYPHDAELLTMITSANICCGRHAGDPATTYRTLVEAARCGVQVGAHPGYADPSHFGRVEQPCDPEAIFRECVYQIGAVRALARTVGLPLRYVKPHGALYNQANREEAFAQPVVRAIGVFELPVMGLPGSALAAAARAEELAYVAEGFADRRYRPDGTLVPRTEADAFVHDPEEAVHQARRLIDERGVQTLCVHGDNPHAVAFVRRLRAALEAAGFTVAPFTPTPAGPPA